MIKRAFFRNKVLWLYPVVIIASQLLSIKYLLVIGIPLAVAGLVSRRKEFYLFSFSMLGHSFWLLVSQYLTVAISNQAHIIILGRLGLIGYIALFFIWQRLQTTDNNYFRLGDMKATIKFPFIWWGSKDYIWRVTLVFCTVCIISAVVIYFAFQANASTIILYGLAFALVNSFLENILWRGFVLGRMVDFVGEKQALILCSLAFGFYHLSLGFSIWVCLLYAIGGFYMGRYTIRSRGLFASNAVHFSVNLIFGFSGMLF